MRSRGNDGNVAAGSSLAVADGCSGFQAAHDGHLDIHQDSVKVILFQSIQRLLAVIHKPDPVTTAL